MSRVQLVLLIALLLVGAAAASFAVWPAPDPAATETEARLRQLVTAYLNYTVARGEAPASRDVLETQVAHLAPFASARCKKCSAHESPFHSLRDGHPFVIRFGVGVSLEAGTAAPPIAYERQGREGTRYIAFANGTVECVPENKVPELLGPEI